MCLFDYAIDSSLDCQNVVSNALLTLLKILNRSRPRVKHFLLNSGTLGHWTVISIFKYI